MYVFNYHLKAEDLLFFLFKMVLVGDGSFSHPKQLIRRLLAMGLIFIRTAEGIRGEESTFSNFQGKKNEFSERWHS